MAEEGSPEAIIPLGQNRRQRGIELWKKAGQHLGVKGFARGGIVGGSEGSVGRGSASINVGGVTINVQGANIEEALSSNKEKIAQEIAGILNTALEATYENTPASA